MALDNLFKHKNSHKVMIHRKLNNVFEQAVKGDSGKEAVEYIQQCNVELASYWASQDSISIPHNIDIDENISERDQEKIYEAIFCKYVMVRPNDYRFMEELSNFYHRMSLKLPYPEGVRLEIGKTKDNSLPIALDNMPLNLDHYIKYRWLLNHPLCAKSEDESLGMIQVIAYIHDDVKYTNKINLDSSIQDQALKIYLKIKEEKKDKIAVMLTLLGLDTRDYEDNDNGNALMIKDLRELSQKESEKFIAMYNNTDIDVLYWAKVFTDLKLWTRMGERYSDRASGNGIAKNFDELRAWYRDKENSEMLAAYKSQAEIELSNKRVAKINKKK